MLYPARSEMPPDWSRLAAATAGPDADPMGRQLSDHTQLGLRYPMGKTYCIVNATLGNSWLATPRGLAPWRTAWSQRQSKPLWIIYRLEQSQPVIKPT